MDRTGDASAAGGECVDGGVPLSTRETGAKCLRLAF